MVYHHGPHGGVEIGGEARLSAKLSGPAAYRFRLGDHTAPAWPDPPQREASVASFRFQAVDRAEPQTPHSSVYRLTPTTEEIARAVAVGSQPRPVLQYELPRPANNKLADDDEDLEFEEDDDPVLDLSK
jgi:hypothetical protein